MNTATLRTFSRSIGIVLERGICVLLPVLYLIVRLIDLAKKRMFLFSSSYIMGELDDGLLWRYLFVSVVPLPFVILFIKTHLLTAQPFNELLMLGIGGAPLFLFRNIQFLLGFRLGS